MSQATIDVLTSTAFLTGILAGAAAVVVGLLAYFIVDAADRPVRVGGLLLVVAALVAMNAAGSVPWASILGIGLLALAGYLPIPSLASPALAIPGALILAYEVGLENAATTWVLAAVIVGVASLVASFDRSYGGQALPVPMYALSVVGLFFTVPDTEIAVVLLGVMVTGVFLGWPKAFVALGSSGSFALAGLFVWVAADGAVARPVSIVVAVGCLGMLLAEPAGRWLSHGRRTLTSGGRLEETMLLVLQFVIVVVVARGVGRVTSAWAAATLTGLVLIVTAGATAMRMRMPSQDRERADS